VVKTYSRDTKQALQKLARNILRKKNAERGNLEFLYCDFFTTAAVVTLLSKAELLMSLLLAQTRAPGNRLIFEETGIHWKRKKQTTNRQ